MLVIRAILIWLLLALPATAQQTSPEVLVIDSERLLRETLYGRRIASDIDALAEELRAENERIIESLTQEERSLTIRRPDMSPEDFRAESEAFDAKVQEVRRVREAKNVDLQVASANARSRFEARVRDILIEIMRDRGAALVIEERDVVLAINSADITADAIVRIDAQLGDGTQ